MDGESLNILKHGWGYTCPVSTVGIFNKCYEATRQNTSASVLALHGLRFADTASVGMGLAWPTILYLQGYATASV